MRRKWIAAMLLLSCMASALAGCGKKSQPTALQTLSPTGIQAGQGAVPGGSTQPPQPATPQQTEPDPVAEGPDLMARTDPSELKPQAIRQGLRRLMTRQTPPAEKLALLRQKWQAVLGPDLVQYVEADLNGDGAPETVAAISTRGCMGGEGALYVIYRKGEAWEVDMSQPAEGCATIYGGPDLDGDGRGELVWYNTVVGAHTPGSYVHVSRWEPGRVTDLLPRPIYMPSMELKVEGKELLLSGGMVGSVGAGMVQRPRTDRWRWQDGTLKLADRRYAPSEVGYHRYIDGVTAETFGRLEEARQAYREAMDPNRMAVEQGSVPMVEEAWRERFTAAMRTLARLRLGALLMREGKATEARQTLQEATGPYAGLAKGAAGASSRQAACAAAEGWARENPEFLQAMNSPFGYANFHFTADNLCGPLVEE